MKAVFADSGYWIAVLIPSDTHHAKALEVSRLLGRIRIVTSEMVLSEVLATLARPPTREYAVSLVDRVTRDPNTDVVPQTGLQFRDALDRYRARADQSWSLVDCASFLIMEQRGIQDALAHDRHFEQAGFKAVLR